jgi:hypothetical protein
MHHECLQKEPVNQLNTEIDSHVALKKIEHEASSHQMSQLVG